MEYEGEGGWFNWIGSLGRQKRHTNYLPDNRAGKYSQVPPSHKLEAPPWVARLFPPCKLLAAPCGSKIDLLSSNPSFLVLPSRLMAQPCICDQNPGNLSSLRMSTQGRPSPCMGQSLGFQRLAAAVARPHRRGAAEGAEGWKPLDKEGRSFTPLLLRRH